MNRKSKAAVAAVIAAATLFTPHWEGTILRTYRDPAPRAIVTACTGHTGPELKMGMTFTKEECSAILAGDLQKHWDGMQQCVNPPAELSQEEWTAYLDFVFNVGVNAFCKSTVARKINAGDRQGACAAMLPWRYAGGKELPGLVRRRDGEYRLCMSGVPQ